MIYIGLSLSQREVRLPELCTFSSFHVLTELLSSFELFTPCSGVESSEPELPQVLGLVQVIYPDLQIVQYLESFS